MGHLERAKRVYGYIKKFKEAAIRVRTEIPNFSDLKALDHEWLTSVYGKPKEEIPDDAPKPLGKKVRTTSYYDANLYHCLVTGRSMTGILHFVNQTPVDWYSKRQSTVATATFGSEFVAAKTCTEQTMDLRITLRYLGAPVEDCAYVFGDNQTVVNQSTLPHSTLSKRHYAVAYHKVREAVAAGIIKMYHISGKINPADVLTKFLGHQESWHLLRPILFWRGDTATSLQTKGSDRLPTDPKRVDHVLSGEMARRPARKPEYVHGINMSARYRPEARMKSDHTVNRKVPVAVTVSQTGRYRPTYAGAVQSYQSKPAT